MRNAGGYFICTGPEGVVEEGDTFTCCHCNSVVLVKPLVSMDKFGGFCTLCMKPTCPRCEHIGECVPFEKRLEAVERRARFGS